MLGATGAAVAGTLGPTQLVHAAQNTAGPAINAARKTFVLVHGTWHGGWAWRKVTPLLEAAGHRVLTPTMTGCGDRFHLIAPDTDLTTHVDDVVNAIYFAEAENIVLVGHSFAGLTITGVADRLQDRIERLVFFDALIPTAERRAAVMRDPETGEWPQWWQDRVAKFGDGYRMNMWDEYPVEMLVPEDDAANIALLRQYITWHPAGQWTQELVLENGGWENLPRTCIHAAGQIYRPSSEAMIGPGRGPGWDFIALDIARDGFLTDPQLLAQTLLSQI